MVTLFHSYFDQNFWKNKKIVCSGIKNNIFYTARQSDDSFGNISGVKRLKQSQTVSWPQTDSRGVACPDWHDVCEPLFTNMLVMDGKQWSCSEVSNNSMTPPVTMLQFGMHGQQLYDKKDTPLNTRNSPDGARLWRVRGLSRAAYVLVDAMVMPWEVSLYRASPNSLVLAAFGFECWWWRKIN